jgi:hypothetical protein
MPDNSGMPTANIAKRNMVWAAIGVAVLIIILAALAFAFKNKSHATQIGSGYQAVFLNNNQVYFGKLAVEGRWMVLTDVYYLQVTQGLQNASNSQTPVTPQNPGQAPQGEQPKINLVKLGSELHGPEDKMYIERDKILFWENMKTDSKVMEAIRQAQ